MVRGGWGGEWLVVRGGWGRLVLGGGEGEVSVPVMLRVFWQFSSGGVDHVSRHLTHLVCSGGGGQNTVCIIQCIYSAIPGNTTPELVEVKMC